MKPVSAYVQWEVHGEKNKEMFPSLPCSLYQKEEQARNYLKTEKASN